MSVVSSKTSPNPLCKSYVCQNRYFLKKKYRTILLRYKTYLLYLSYNLLYLSYNFLYKNQLDSFTRDNNRYTYVLNRTIKISLWDQYAQHQISASTLLRVRLCMDQLQLLVLHNWLPIHAYTRVFHMKKSGFMTI